MAYVLSIVAVLLYLAALVAIILFPKSDKPENVVIWIPVAFFLLMCIDGLAAGVFTFVGIPVNLYSSSGVHALVVIAMLIAMRRAGTLQRLVVCRADLISLAAVIVLVLVCARAQFGPNLTPHYALSDAAVHLKYAISIVQSGQVGSSYLAWNLVAQWIEIASCLVPQAFWYKIYIVADIAFLLMGTLLFRSVFAIVLPNGARLASERTSKPQSTWPTSVVTTLFALLYAFGYPLQAMQIGYLYLGAGMSVGMLSAFFCHRALAAQNEGYPLLPICVCLGFALFGVVVCYPVFAPAIWAAAFIVLLLCLHRCSAAVFRRGITALVLAFIAVGLGGFSFFYTGYLGGDLSKLSSLGNQGHGIYAAIYADYVFFAPFILAALFFRIKGKLRWSRALFVFFICAAAYALLFLVLMATGVVSAYYMGKTYYLLWPFALLVAGVGVLSCFESSGFVLVASCGVTAACVAALALGNADYKLEEIQNNNNDGGYELPYYASSYHPYVRLYTDNYTRLKTQEELDSGLVELSTAVAGYVESGYTVPGVLHVELMYWYDALTCQNDIGSYYITRFETAEELVEEEFAQFDYIAVCTLNPYEFAATSEVFPAADELIRRAVDEGRASVVFENDVGYIVQVNH